MRKNYNTDEVAEIARAYSGLAYAKVAVDSIDLNDNPKKNIALLRTVVENVLPTFYETVPNLVRRRLDNIEIIRFAKKCEGLLEQLTQGDNK